jgi:SHS2 domain-containing protein
LSFRLFEHTADLGIEAKGETADEALAQAALALTSVLTGKPSAHALGRPDGAMHFVVEAPDHGALAVAFLSEVLWHFEAQDQLWVGGGVRVTKSQDGLRAEADGNAVMHEARMGRGVEVKAVTYHELHFARERDGWLLRVILDI